MAELQPGAAAVSCSIARPRDIGEPGPERKLFGLSRANRNA